MKLGYHGTLLDEDNNCIGHMHTEESAKELVDMVDARMRTLQALQDVRDRRGPSGMINASQVIGLLSLTWPDGNYSSGG